jgi:hypothetical protein
MKKEKEIRSDIQRGVKAKQLLEEPMIIEFFEDAKQALIENLENPEIDEESQKESVRMLKIHARFKREFEKYMKTGKKSESLLDKLLNSVKERKA